MVGGPSQVLSYERDIKIQQGPAMLGLLCAAAAAPSAGSLTYVRLVMFQASQIVCPLESWVLEQKQNFRSINILAHKQKY